MKITFLGTGPSQGLPIIGGKTAASLSTDSKDFRFRTSAKIESENTCVVIDCGPDFRMQMLQSGTKKIDAILLTHEHNDHINGLDDIRPFYFMQQKPIPVYCTKEVEAALKIKYYYFFQEPKYPGVPEIEIHIIDTDPFQIGDMEFQPIPLNHGEIRVTGFEVNELVYICDSNGVPPESMPWVQRAKVLVVNALREEKHHSHFTLSEALELIEKVGVEKAYLTALGPKLPPHAELQAHLPKHIAVAYDGLSFEF